MFGRLLGIACLLLLSEFSSADALPNVNLDTYEIYFGDLNGDGNSDYYFNPKPLFVLIHSDVSIPLMIGQIGAFAVYRNATGYDPVQIFVLSSAEFASKVASGQLVLAQPNVDAFSWSSATAGNNNILIRGATPADPSLLIATSANSFPPEIVQTYPPSTAISDIYSMLSPGGYIAASGTSTNSVKTLKYTYDALGRLTYTEDSINGNRDYDYDRAGNRLQVSVGTANDAAAEPPIPAAPVLGSCSQIAPGAWKGVWNAVPGAAYYIFRLGDNYTSYYTSNELNGAVRVMGTSTPVYSIPTSTPPCKWVKACNANDICGPQTNF